MRDYQVQGLNWMISLHHNGINGILADEMVSRNLLELDRTDAHIDLGSRQDASNNLVLGILEVSPGNSGSSPHCRAEINAQ